jgi:hypothetical protein
MQTLTPQGRVLAQMEQVRYNIGVCHPSQLKICCPVEWSFVIKI